MMMSPKEPQIALPNKYRPQDPNRLFTSRSIPTDAPFCVAPSHQQKIKRFRINRKAESIASNKSVRQGRSLSKQLPLNQQRMKHTASSPISYAIADKGEIYHRLNQPPLNRTLAARFVLDTPIFEFLDIYSLMEAACVCKYWWSEIWSPARMQFFFGLPELRSSKIEQRRKTPQPINSVAARDTQNPSTDAHSQPSHHESNIEFFVDIGIMNIGVPSIIQTQLDISPCLPSYPINHDAGNRFYHIPFLPPIRITAENRSVIWRLALVGEFDNLDIQVFNCISPPLLRHDNKTQSELLRPERRNSLKAIDDIPFMLEYGDSNIYGMKNEIFESGNSDESKVNRRQYNKRLSGSSTLMTDDIDSNVYSNVYEGLIKRDVDRTFPHRPLFANQNNKNDWSSGQYALCRSLQYVSIKRSRDLGYCQGMNFVAATFIEIFKSDELTAARCFNSFLFRPEIGPMFEPTLMNAQLACCDLDSLVQYYLPYLFHHFNKLGLNALTYGLQWIVTFLSYDMPLSSLVHIWDQMILFGPSIIYQTILGVLYYEESNLLSLSFEPCLGKLKRLMSNAHLTIYDLALFVVLFPLDQFTPGRLRIPKMRRQTFEPMMSQTSVVPIPFSPTPNSSSIISLYPSSFLGSMFSACHDPPVQNDLSLLKEPPGCISPCQPIFRSSPNSQQFNKCQNPIFEAISSKPLMTNSQPDCTTPSSKWWSTIFSLVERHKKDRLLQSLMNPSRELSKNKSSSSPGFSSPASVMSEHTGPPEPLSVWCISRVKERRGSDIPLTSKYRSASLSPLLTCNSKYPKSRGTTTASENHTRSVHSRDAFPFELSERHWVP